MVLESSYRCPSIRGLELVLRASRLPLPISRRSRCQAAPRFMCCSGAWSDVSTNNSEITMHVTQCALLEHLTSHGSGL